MKKNNINIFDIDAGCGKLNASKEVPPVNNQGVQSDNSQTAQRDDWSA